MKLITTNQTQDVLDFVNNHPTILNAAEISHALQLKPRVVGSYLSRLHADGKIARVARGVYAAKEENTRLLTSAP
jgi:predicted transcriptional regulator of viral defense system